MNYAFYPKVTHQVPLRTLIERCLHVVQLHASMDPVHSLPMLGSDELLLQLNLAYLKFAVIHPELLTQQERFDLGIALDTLQAVIDGQPTPPLSSDCFRRPYPEIALGMEKLTQAWVTHPESRLRSLLEKNPDSEFFVHHGVRIRLALETFLEQTTRFGTAHYTAPLLIAARLYKEMRGKDQSVQEEASPILVALKESLKKLISLPDEDNASLIHYLWAPFEYQGDLAKLSPQLLEQVAWEITALYYQFRCQSRNMTFVSAEPLVHLNQFLSVLGRIRKEAFRVYDANACASELEFARILYAAWVGQNVEVLLADNAFIRADDFARWLGLILRNICVDDIPKLLAYLLQDYPEKAKALLPSGTKLEGIWLHLKSGAFYVVYDVSNASSTRDDFPWTVSYRSLETGERYSRPVSLFTDRAVPFFPAWDAAA